MGREFALAIIDDGKHREAYAGSCIDSIKDLKDFDKAFRKTLREFKAKAVQDSITGCVAVVPAHPGLKISYSVFVIEEDESYKISYDRQYWDMYKPVKKKQG